MRVIVLTDQGVEMCRPVGGARGLMMAALPKHEANPALFFDPQTVPTRSWQKKLRQRQNELLHLRFALWSTEQSAAQRAMEKE